jgi:geranylgeranyl diphosphate synthase type I
MTGILPAVQIVPADPVLPASCEGFRASVDVELYTFLDDVRTEIASMSPDAVLLVEELARLLRAGGKRLRPLFCFWGHRAGGGTDGVPIARAGAAVELLHTSAIVHDDVLDHAPQRRGEPTSHRALSALGAVPGRMGTAGAILAGDLAHALADRLLAESGFRPARVVGAFVHFNRMRVEAIAGELLDLLWANRDPESSISAAGRAAGWRPDEASARMVASLKSGSYTVTGPLLMGAGLAEAMPDVLDALRRYGGPLGEAFQLRDDVLGTFGDPVRTGKGRDTDIREGKLTTVLAKAHRMGSNSARRLIEDRVGRRDMSADDVDAIRDTIRTSGALAETLELIASLANRAKAALSDVRIDADAAAALTALADLVATRDA